MDIEDQVISQEQSERLKDLWFEKESEFRHCYEWDENNRRTGKKTVELDCDIEYFDAQEHKICPAYTAEEICQYLPATIAKDGINYEHHINKWITDTYATWYLDYESKRWLDDTYCTDSSMAKSLWKTLIYLLFIWKVT